MQLEIHMLLVVAPPLKGPPPRLSHMRDPLGECDRERQAAIQTKTPTLFSIKFPFVAPPEALKELELSFFATAAAAVHLCYFY